MNEDKPKTEAELLEEADRLAAEVEAELQQNIGDFEALAGLDGIPPELLEQLTPEQLQELIAMQAAQQRKPQSYYTRKQTKKADRKKKRKAQARARRITSKKGWGRTIPVNVRKRKAAAKKVPVHKRAA